ncbi:hypothetical protein ZYGR_0P02910 [Zygosaccharomyces rouxii]|uniref:ZYRO0E07326p n=2 Tax=Zygosaccharomyces rouxii TaxID=4956 RepID=C5E4M6_ZYGRC|nr:uncharacterized protein ZYRO0E07326g [Zygosaccharomyces rouxii]KAH9198157.1 cyclin-domain-containing protein [Zygosaccharomyces rouxii]GAV49646.1 hypothetical protein ZYGR_0P02910 [Zygosaccharomyces rouxii]CAR30987.1 ZYRO0E07326p [Zygosaccharomyces rouxii]
MELNFEKIQRPGFVPDGLSEASDIEEDDEDGFAINDLDDDDVENSFELPIRASPYRFNNFSALNDDWRSFRRGNSGINKRVRFDNDRNNNGDEDGRNRSQSDSPKGKKNVEELLQYANRVNEYLALNLEKIDMFRSELMDSDGMPYKSIGSETTLATTATTASGSVSNFELSESEMDEDKINLNSSVSGISSDSERAWEKTPLSQDSGRDELRIPSFEQILQHVRRANEREGEKETTENEDNISSITNCETMETSQAIEIFQNTINCILHMSQAQDQQDVPNPRDWDFNQFSMKSMPTVTYQEFITRIQTKCTYSPAVFLASAFLLQTLCLMRNDNNGELCLRHRLQDSQIHRLVIACVRIATKIMEDHVHSHQYFSKVCGISKRLLSRLEISLVTCLKDEQFMVTRERLAATAKIKDELVACESNQS